MIDSKNIEEALEFKELDNILKTRYHNNIAKMLINYDWYNIRSDSITDREYFLKALKKYPRGYFFKVLWHYRNHKSLGSTAWIRIINDGYYIWELEDFNKFRKYLDWNLISKCLADRQLCFPRVHIREFLDKFKRYLNWNIINKSKILMMY